LSQPILEARGLAKLFGVTPVFSGVDLKIHPGEAVLISGRNGVGKSTLIKTLCGLSAPDSGESLIFGRDCRQHRSTDHRVGVLTHQSMLYPNLTARENLEFYGQLYSMPSPAAGASQWLERMDLAAASDKRVRSFSRGMEQRLAIARAMLPEPELILMDEPFAALDGDGVAIVADLIKGSIARRCAVLITAHAPLDLGGLQFTTYELARGRLLALSGQGHRERLRSLSAG
jgi:heme exporter protein A